MKHPDFTAISRKVVLTVMMGFGLSSAMAQSVYVQRSHMLGGSGGGYSSYSDNNRYTTETVREESTSATFQLHTNGLYDLALCPNVGLEFQTSLGLAFQFDYIGAWWNSPSCNRFYSNYAFQSEIRYYFSNDGTTRNPFKGLHAGAYGQMATYDFEFGGEGYQSPSLEMSWGLGLSGGYTLPISRKWSLDFTLGLGYFQSKYYVYNPNYRAGGSGYIKESTKRLKFWGPTRAEVSLVWNINKENKRK